MKNLVCLTGVLLFAITTYAQDCKLNEQALSYPEKSLQIKQER